MAQDKYRVAVDVGGTFTDLVILNETDGSSSKESLHRLNEITGNTLVHILTDLQPFD